MSLFIMLGGWDVWKVLVQFQQRSRPVEFTRVPGTRDVILLKDAVQQVFCDLSKLGIPGAVLILRYIIQLKYIKHGVFNIKK